MKLLTALLACLATGCAAMDRIYDEARWEYDGLEVATYTWHVENDPVRCGIHYNMNRGQWGCAVRTIGSTPQPGAKPVPGTKGRGGHCFIYSSSPDDEPIVYVDLLNSTPEPDGSTKRYMLRVDPSAYNGMASRDCLAAVASTWRHKDGALVFKRPQDYRPEFES